MCKCLCTRVHNIKVATIAWIKHITVEGYGICLCTRVHNIKVGDNCMNKAHHCWGYGKCLCTRVHNIKVVTIAWIKHITVEVMVNAYVQEFTI